MITEDDGAGFFSVKPPHSRLQERVSPLLLLTIRCGVVCGMCNVHRHAVSVCRRPESDSVHTRFSALHIAPCRMRVFNVVQSANTEVLRLPVSVLETVLCKYAVFCSDAQLDQSETLSAPTAAASGARDQEAAGA